MNSAERQLSDLLHRVTPEPPREVAVEDVAIRAARQAGRRGSRGSRVPRPRRPAWAPVLAAASVVAVIGLSAGIALLASSHHRPPPQAAASPNARASASALSSPPARTSSPAQAFPAIPGGPWGAELINRQLLVPGSLVSSGGSLYAIGTGALDRIDPATGDIVRTVPLGSLVTGPPVVTGTTAWVVSDYGGGSVVLHGYNAVTLAQAASVTVPATGQVSSTAQGVLAAGPDGRLYLAAGDTVAVLNPATGQVISRIFLGTMPAGSVAVSPDGRRLYVGTVTGGSFTLLTYDLASGTQIASSAMPAAGTAGNLTATSGGVWGTAGTGMSEWAWFAPGGNLSRSVRVGPVAGGGLDSVPAVSGGAVWIGGPYALTCASPATGQVLASAVVPAPGPAIVGEYFGSLATAGGHAYASYTDQLTQQHGLARMTPPAACTAPTTGR